MIYIELLLMLLPCVLVLMAKVEVLPLKAIHFIYWLGFAALLSIMLYSGLLKLGLIGEIFTPNKTILISGDFDSILTSTGISLLYLILHTYIPSSAQHLGVK